MLRIKHIFTLWLHKKTKIADNILTPKLKLRFLASVFPVKFQQEPVFNRYLIQMSNSVIHGMDYKVWPKLILKDHMDPSCRQLWPNEVSIWTHRFSPAPPIMWSRPAQLRAQGVEFLHSPVPPWSVHPELHRLRTRPGRRHDDSRPPPNQHQEDRDRVKDHTSSGTGSDRARCDPIRTRNRVIPIRSQI